MGPVRLALLPKGEGTLKLKLWTALREPIAQRQVDRRLEAWGPANVAMLLATSPAALPPIPSHTTYKCCSASYP